MHFGITLISVTHIRVIMSYYNNKEYNAFKDKKKLEKRKVMQLRSYAVMQSCSLAVKESCSFSVFSQLRPVSQIRDKGRGTRDKGVWGMGLGHDFMVYC
jgi:hypothetical protein